MKKFKNAWEYLNSLPQDYQDHVWDDLLDQPVAELVEHLLKVSKPSLIRGIVLEYAADSKICEEVK